MVATMDGDVCDAEDFLMTGEQTTKSSRIGLTVILKHIAENGLQNTAAWVHEASKSEKIYEFCKGSLRLFFFHGEGNCIAVCTSGLLKKGQKADKSAVNKAANLRKDYFAAVANQTIEVIEDEDK